MNWSDFFAMGGYALYVWGSYGVTALVLAIEVVLVLRKKRSVLHRLAQFARAMRVAERAES